MMTSAHCWEACDVVALVVEAEILKNCCFGKVTNHNAGIAAERWQQVCNSSELDNGRKKLPYSHLSLPSVVQRVPHLGWEVIWLTWCVVFPKLPLDSACSFGWWVMRCDKALLKVLRL